MKLLVVDSNPTLGQVIKRTLEESQFKDVTLVEGIDEALTRLRDELYDLVVADWKPIQGVDGVALTRMLRGTRAYRTTPVLIVSVRDRAEDVLLAMEAGANDYLLKPFNPVTLLTKVERLLQVAA